MNKSKRIIITLLALIGLALSIELCVVYFNANFVPDAKPSVCVISETMDCDGVAKTSYSQFLGVPLSLWGVCLYLFLLFMTYVDKLKNIKFLGFLNVFKNPLSYIFCITSLSFIISMGLAYISINKINSICIFCLITYFIDLLIALTSKSWKSGLFYELKNSIADFIEAIKVRRYAFWFVLLVLLAASVLTYTSVSDILAPQIIKQKLMKNSFNEYKNIVEGNVMGPKDAEVIIHEFMDFNCGGCFIANLYLHRIVAEFTNVKVMQHNVPFEKSCNPNLPIEGHKNSCIKSKYALAALNQGKYWEMSDILFVENPETEKDIIEKARLADFDVKKLKQDAHSPEVKAQLDAAIAEAEAHEVTGTPTIFVGFKKLLGVGPYSDLKEIVKSQGGKLKPQYE